MKRDNIIGTALMGINILLLLLCIVFYLRTDQTEPKFMIQAVEAVYIPGTDNAALFEGISAKDDRDGDVTDRIVLEKIVENPEENMAVAYFAVSDKAGNIAKFSKLFHAEFPEKAAESTETVENGASSTGKAEPDAGSAETAGQEETAAGEAGTGETAEGTGEAAEGTGETENGNGETENGTGETENGNGEAENGNGETADTGGNPAGEENHAETGQAAGPQPAEPVNTGAPELVFGSSEVTIEAGTNVPWVNIITTMRDDKDNYETLYYNLHVSQYNRNKPGTYPVTVYVEDSDGNQSQHLPFTIIVK